MIPNDGEPSSERTAATPAGDLASLPATMPPADSLPPSRVRYDQAWLTSFLRPLLIGIMVGCINVAFGAFLHRFLPDAPAGLYIMLVVLGVIAAVIACISTAWLAQPNQRLNRTAAYRGAEVALVIMVVRIGLWLIPGVRPTPAELFLQPIDTFFDGYFILAALVVLFSWFWAIDFSADLLGMALQADELYLVDTASERSADSARPASTNRTALLDRFTTRWIGGGLILIVLAAGSRVDVNDGLARSLLRQPIDPYVISAIIVYFFAGLLLISQGQLALLRARWTIERVPINESISRNWSFYVLLLLGTIGILAALLPLGGTEQLSRWLAAIINGLYIAIYTIYRLLFLLVLALLSLLPFIGEEMTLPPAPPPAEQTEPAQFGEPLPFMEWAGGLLFWAMTAVLLINAALIYFGAHHAGRAWLWRLWQQIRAYWLQLFGAYKAWQRTTARQLPAAERVRRPVRFRMREWIDRLRSGSLTPEQRIRYYYLAMLEQGEHFGTPRNQSETPSHYVPRLNTALYGKDDSAEPAPPEAGNRNDVRNSADPGAKSDPVHALTVEFERVRYAGLHVSAAAAQQAADLYARIRTMMGKR